MNTVQMCDNEVEGDYDKEQPEANVSSNLSDDGDKDDSIMDESSSIMDDNTDYDEDVFQSKIVELVYDIDVLGDIIVGNNNNTSSRITTRFSDDLDSVLSNSEYFQQSFIQQTRNNDKRVGSEHNNNNHARLHGWGKPFYCINDDVKKDALKGFNKDYMI